MFVFLFIIICLCATFYFKQSVKDAGLFFEGEYYIYLNTKQNTIPSFATSVDNGQGQIVNCDIKFKDQLNFDDDQVAGTEIKLDAHRYSFEQVCNILNFRIKQKYNFSDGLKTFYGESDYTDKYLYIKKDRINCQIAQSGDVIHIGFPILLGSY